MRLVSCASRAEANASAAQGSVGGLVVDSGKLKWAHLLCPCGCGEILALNLMESHWPYWTASIEADGVPTLYPSVDSEKCGAHFWVREGEIIWFEPPTSS